ncbi:MAG: ABC transporter substrate-binding protein [Deltaproteobacteria bacterium]|nr:ABC transporter substrate-binding protein [Deltaproteobacteria bacterium]
MDFKLLRNRSKADLAVALLPSVLLAVVAAVGGAIAYQYVDPAPPKRFVISTGDGEGDYDVFAKRYREIIKEEGVELVIRRSEGATENLERLNDPKSDVDVAFVQDGLGSAQKSPELMSLGSLYYEPIWLFYRGSKTVSRFSQLAGKRIAVDEVGSGTRTLVEKLLKAAGVDASTSTFVEIGDEDAAAALKAGKVDAAFFLGTPDDEQVRTLIQEKGIRLMSAELAEAITRQVPFLHHLVLPRGALDLRRGLPEQDVDLVAPTATLVARDSLHPALISLLLNAASQVHSYSGIFEKKNEFPSDKSDEFPISLDAEHFYKSGVPFWQKHLPFWLATLVNRFIVVVVPLLVVILPLARTVPRLYQWRVRSRIYQRYGELKFLESQMARDRAGVDYLKQLDAIEERVNKMKVPLDHTEYVYALRQNIEFVRGRLRRGA